MKVSMTIAALLISASAFATKPATTPAATTAPAAAPTATATAPGHTKMTEADAKKACMTEKAADMTKCVAGKMAPAASH